MKHTPGPWGYSRTHQRSLNYWYVIVDSDGRGPIIDVGGKDLNNQIGEFKHLITDQEEIEANAKLIASSPELLEHSYNLSMLVLQSDLYKADPEVREEVDKLLSIWKHNL